jgi:hypothetical protein
LLVLPKQFQARDGFFAFVAFLFHSFLIVPNKLLGFVAFVLSFQMVRRSFYEWGGGVYMRWCM